MTPRERGLVAVILALFGYVALAVVAANEAYRVWPRVDGGYPVYANALSVVLTVFSVAAFALGYGTATLRHMEA